MGLETGGEQAGRAWSWPRGWRGGAQHAVRGQEASAPIPAASRHSALQRRIPYKFNQMPASSSAFLLFQFEYKLDREFLKGCKLSVTDDKDMVLALRNSIIESDVSIRCLPSWLTSLGAVLCGTVSSHTQGTTEKAAGVGAQA